MHKIAIGSAQFGMSYGLTGKDRVDGNEVSKILQLAQTHSIHTIDTAVMYGESERALGLSGVTNFDVVTKLPQIPDYISDVEGWIESTLEDSLNKLNIESVYGLLLHRPDQLLSKQGSAIYDALNKVKAKGQVKKVGISIYDPSELDAIFDQFKHLKDFKLDLVQAPFNIFDRRLISSGWAERLVESKTEIHIRSIFLQGLLLMSPKDRSKKFSRWNGLWNEWDQWLLRNDISPLKACVQFATRQEYFSRVVVGVELAEQLQDILSALEQCSFTVPESLSSHDIDLINPARWDRL